MITEIKKGKILFIDDEKAGINQFMSHLTKEGFTNLSYLKDITSLAQVVDFNADVIFLDITGVATSIDAENEGIAILTYVKKHSPWTGVIILSGSDFPPTKAPDLIQADGLVTKASLSLAELVDLTEQTLNKVLSPEFRNVRICNILEEKIDQLSLSWIKKKRLIRLLNTMKSHEGDPSFNWTNSVKTIQKTLSSASDLTTILSLFIA